MAVDGGRDPGSDWDEARVALGRVADIFRENETVDRESLRAVDNYRLIPEGVRETLESLTPEEQEVAKRVSGSLAANHFYIENGEGGLRF